MTKAKRKRRNGEEGGEGEGGKCLGRENKGRHTFIDDGTIQIRQNDIFPYRIDNRKLSDAEEEEEEKARSTVSISLRSL